MSAAGSPQLNKLNTIFLVERASMDAQKEAADAPVEADAIAGPVVNKLGFKFTQSKARPLLPSNSVPSARAGDGVSREFVSAVGEGRIETTGGKASAELKVIPKLENKWRPESKMRSLQETMRDYAIEQKTEDRFEVEETIAAGKVDGVQYGLQIRVKKEVRREVNGALEPPAESSSRAYRSAQELEAQQLKKDLNELPDEADEDAYDSMPIEDFGKAMLRGMGWVEGKAVGRNAKGKVVEPVVNVPRPDRLGLGANPKPQEVKERKYIKPGETRGPKPDLVAAPGSDGRPRNSRKVDEQLVEREKKGVHVGKVMEIVTGRHSGLKGEILSIKKTEGRSDRATVRLRGSEEVVEVRVQELADVASVNGHNSDRAGRASNGDARVNGAARNGTNGREAGPSREGGRRGDDIRLKRKVDESRREVEEGDRRGEDAPWLVPHIRVRIVSKSLQSGRLYLKKATVVDVVTPTTADLTVDETGQSLQGVHQSSLETALPKRGGNVAVVTGKERGRRGRLLERDSERGIGVVQFSDHRVEGVEVVRLELDSVAEFVGHDEDLD
ncbi:G-patch domain-containing protein [Klebsormidium nitens]|uniref:G-patch domain-containing protein n=1 Tax=Klebsormidium nitens TaxID=105231 RepID=A0A1Y1IAJ7_KLENI|nr:G-patch domain-containing protein [Klebsormidium nitens]|eukprot:GAQ87593.1 G-patch domain-containing protein [Klebsormidium nitens]